MARKGSRGSYWLVARERILQTQVGEGLALVEWRQRCIGISWMSLNRELNMVISFLKAANLAGGEQQIDAVHSGGSLNQDKHILIISQSSRHGQEKIEMQNDKLIFFMSNSNANEIPKETSDKEDIKQPNDPYIHNSTILNPNRRPSSHPPEQRKSMGYHRESYDNRIV